MRPKSNKSFEERHKDAMDKYRAKSAFITIPKDVHARLKVYCEHHGYVMSRFVSNLIKKNIQ